MLVAVIPLVVAIIGLLMYVLASNPKVQELGRILFFCGALVTLMGVGNKSWHLGASYPASSPAPSSLA